MVKKDSLIDNLSNNPDRLEKICRKVNYKYKREVCEKFFSLITDNNISNLGDNSKRLIACRGNSSYFNELIDNDIIFKIKYHPYTLSIKCFIARNPNCPVEVLEKLSDDSDWWVNFFVATSINCPVHILEKLSNAYYWNVRYAVVNNPYCPTHILEKLINDCDKGVAKKAAEKLTEKINK